MYRLWGMARDYVWQALWDQLVAVLGNHPFTYIYLGTTLVSNQKRFKRNAKHLQMPGFKHRILGSWLSVPILWFHTEARGEKSTFHFKWVLSNLYVFKAMLFGHGYGQGQVMVMVIMTRCCFYPWFSGAETVQGPAWNQRAFRWRET